MTSPSDAQLDADPVLAAVATLAAADERIDVLWLYGSRARGTATEASDYDLAVAFNTFEDSVLERRLQPELLALDWAASAPVQDGRLSVADINNIPLPLAFSVISEGRVLFCRSGLRLAREENRVTAMWELDYQYHRRRYG